ncbi:BQ2448_4284 [Microbotryum intermedium]|uniref:BQ2448_4284 protein n=1 Tax=Microbotryum intermedium TaxID=269621 RepID=A0A238FHN0_9BASI|nr:BQ2448_4284 [Microbotryum intermedium]
MSSSTSTSASTSSSPLIHLTPDEAHLCSLLVACADWVDSNPDRVDALRLKDVQTGQWIGNMRGDEPVELRIAGGWVRDKLLGLTSDDIDVSTSPDPITGLKFATLFEQYLESIGERELMGRLTKIEAKPEQSKHLETATAKVCGLSVDWVQQRGQEVYTQGSRIPTVVSGPVQSQYRPLLLGKICAIASLTSEANSTLVKEFGTPLEDAERRDLTINALFYNLRTQQIEDQTQKGLADLGLVPDQPKRIRTPLEPFRTFHDDPLRVIRAVRFAARFGKTFELDTALVEAIKREEIRAALRDPKKISRERVGIELDKMLTGQWSSEGGFLELPLSDPLMRQSGKDPHLAMELIMSLDLHELIFYYDASVTPTSTSSDRPLPLTSVIEASSTLTTLLDPSLSPPLHPLLRLQIVPLDPTLLNPHYPSPPPSSTPLDAFPIFPQTKRRLYLACALIPFTSHRVTDSKGKTLCLGEKIVRDGLKWSSNDALWVRKAMEAQDSIRNVLSTPPIEWKREDLGLLLRSLNVDDRGHTRWNVSLLWSLVHEFTRIECAHPQWSQEEKEGALRSLSQKYNDLVVRVLEWRLETQAFEPPILDGNTVNKLLPRSKNSPAMVRILEMVVKRQLTYPDAKEEEIARWLTEDQQALDEVEKALKAFEKPKRVVKTGPK